MKSRFCRFILTAACVIAVSGAISLSLAPAVSYAAGAQTNAQDYDALISDIVALIQAGKIDEASIKALEAVRIQPARYEGHLYLGIVRFRQNAVPDAEASLTKALSLAPPDRKAKVQETLDAVSKTRRFTEFMAAAEQAEADGLKAKAARSYAAAWWLFNDRVDVAAKALKGLTATGEHFEAARIWNVLTKKQRDENAEHLKGCEPDWAKVQEACAEKQTGFTAQIKAGKLREAIELGIPLSQADPALYNGPVAALLFLTGDTKAALRWAGALDGRLNQMIRRDLFLDSQLQTLLADPKFLNYVEDAVGNKEQTLKRLRLVLSEPARGAVKTNAKDGGVLVFVPSGDFVMGEGSTRRTVFVEGYYVYKTPVTVVQYRGFCQDTGRKMPDPPSWGWKDDHPMVNVSALDADEYSKWAGVRLPTEEEWEKAARGEDGRMYPWGNTWDPSRLQCSKSEIGDAKSTAAVGSFPRGASPFGVLDMAGNVWQWTSSSYDADKRVVRGGSWDNFYPDYFRAAYRDRRFPTYWDVYNGFRCASGP